MVEKPTETEVEFSWHEDSEIAQAAIAAGEAALEPRTPESVIRFTSALRAMGGPKG